MTVGHLHGWNDEGGGDHNVGNRCEGRNCKKMLNLNSYSMQIL